MVRYFHTKTVGDYIAGEFCYWDEDRWGNDVIVLWTGPFDGARENTRLPGHQSINEQVDSACQGDYFRVTFDGFEESSYFDAQKYLYRITHIPKKTYWEILEKWKAEVGYDEAMRRLGARFTAKEIDEMNEKARKRNLIKRNK